MPSGGPRSAGPSPRHTAKRADRAAASSHKLLSCAPRGSMSPGPARPCTLFQQTQAFPCHLVPQHCRRLERGDPLRGTLGTLCDALPSTRVQQPLPRATTPSQTRPVSSGETVTPVRAPAQSSFPTGLGTHHPQPNPRAALSARASLEEQPVCGRPAAVTGCSGPSLAGRCPDTQGGPCTQYHLIGKAAQGSSRSEEDGTRGWGPLPHTNPATSTSEAFPHLESGSKARTQSSGPSRRDAQRQRE